MSFTNILMSYDGSEPSKKALEKAIALTEQNNAKLTLLHAYHVPSMVSTHPFLIVPPEYMTNVADTENLIVEELRALVSHLSNAQAVVANGQPAKVILDYAKEQQCDLIVMGSRGLGGLQELVLGSVSHNVVQHAPIPVLIVK